MLQAPFNLCLPPFIIIPIVIVLQQLTLFGKIILIDSQHKAPMRHLVIT